MKNTSTGTGLVVLSITIGACFIHARVGIEPQAMAQHASNLGRHPGSALPLTPDTCSLQQTRSWLDLTPHRIDACTETGIAAHSQAYADLNADGEMEFFVVQTLECITNGTAVSTGWLIADQSPSAQSGSSLGRFPVASLDGRLGDDFLQLFPEVQSASTYPNGWRDMDADGDLDLVLLVSESRGSRALYYWFENTGLPSLPPPNPYDHDGDGSVNTADLSLLLLNFD